MAENNEKHGGVDEQTWAVFEDDAQTAMSAIEAGLLVLESDHTDKNELNSLFRGLHTLKGSAGFLGLTALSLLAHVAEDLVGNVRDDKVELTVDMVTGLLAGLDMLRIIVTESRDGPVEEHLALIEPHCATLRAFSGADARGITSYAHVCEASQALRPMLQAHAAACAAGVATLPPDLSKALADIRTAADSIAQEEYAECLDDIEYALARGHGRTLDLYWYLAHRKAEEDEDAGAVFFFEDEDSGATTQDTGATKIFLVSLSQLLGPLVHALQTLRLGSGGGDDLQAVVGEMVRASRTMGFVRLEEILTRLDALGPADLHESPNIEALAEDLLFELGDIQTNWCAATGLTLAHEHDVTLVGPKLWDGNTQPYRQAASAASAVSAAPREDEAPATAPTPEPQQSAPEKPISLAAAAERRQTTRRSKFLRIEVEKVEQLMALAGEIGLAAGSVFNHPEFDAAETEGLQSRMDRVEGLIRELQDISAGLALVPIGTVFDRMRRLARDLVQQTGKKFVLVTEGGDTEIDKVLVDALMDPLIHLIRNAADHGIEETEARHDAGKSHLAKITLSAKHNGDNVTIAVQDDGAGMRREAILEHAVSRGILTAEAGAELDDNSVWNLVFEPGFSTAETVSNISGRGIGMDVVKTSIEAHRGRISVSSRAGKGTTVRLQVPLTLAFLDGMIVRVGNCFYVIPVNSILRVFRVEDDDLVRVQSEGVDLVQVGTELVPALALEGFFSGSESQPEIIGRLVVVVQAANGKMAIPIDELVGQEQVTMKPLMGFLRKIRGGAACGLLRSGEVAIALDCDQLRDLMCCA